jgi:[acyl-carrier-protein] S-malonyltransferase
MVALLFPGQGSQKIGMGHGLAEVFPVARETLAEADDALGFALSTLCFQGPDEALKQTENTQPALLAVSVATWRALRSLSPELVPTVVAGHSLGEWSALVVAGALPFADALRAVRRRGQLMQEAVPAGAGAMAAILGLDAERITALCAEVSTPEAPVEPANLNGPDQTVISGAAAAVERAGLVLKEAGAKKVVPLQVSAPFHCSLMRPAAEGLRAVLADIPISAPIAPVITNVEAAPNTDAGRIAALLVEQVTAPVRWVECVQAIGASGEKLALELGPSGVLRGLARRIDRELEVLSIEDPASLEKAVARLSEVGA